MDNWLHVGGTDRQARESLTEGSKGSGVGAAPQTSTVLAVLDRPEGQESSRRLCRPFRKELGGLNWGT